MSSRSAGCSSASCTCFGSWRLGLGSVFGGSGDLGRVFEFLFFALCFVYFVFCFGLCFLKFFGLCFWV